MWDFHELWHVNFSKVNLGTFLGSFWAFFHVTEFNWRPDLSRGILLQARFRGALIRLVINIIMYYVMYLHLRLFCSSYNKTTSVVFKCAQIYEVCKIYEICNCRKAYSYEASKYVQSKKVANSTMRFSISLVVTIIEVRTTLIFYLQMNSRPIFNSLQWA